MVSKNMNRALTDATTMSQPLRRKGQNLQQRDQGLDQNISQSLWNLLPGVDLEATSELFDLTEEVCNGIVRRTDVFGGLHLLVNPIA